MAFARPDNKAADAAHSQNRKSWIKSSTSNSSKDLAVVSKFVVTRRISSPARTFASSSSWENLMATVVNTRILNPLWVR